MSYVPWTGIEPALHVVNVPVIHVVVVASDTYHHVSACAALHHRGARLFIDNILRQSGTP